ncbi:GBS Bsp-like repeat-containing protein [Paenibacillus sp. BIHB 4019]|uniref:GBS Bsp-like repeat-containing protein n=1 Tax=Paenibacillus sp. BIHB 4019 TaxID=1870819 RepID=UPI000C149304|nr:GBS Bsp-like repeat-containing protein [Paenibacillus sp. BIHB 4019]
MLNLFQVVYQRERQKDFKFVISLIVSIAILFVSQNSIYAASSYYEYDDSNRLIAIYTMDGNKQYKITYNYDAAGNLISKSKAEVSSILAPKETSYSNVSYEIIVNGIDSNATNVRFKTSTSQDPAPVWRDGEKVTGGIWKITIPFNEHVGIGLYTTDIYVGNTLWNSSSTTVKQTTSIRIPTEPNLAAKGYEVYVDGVGDRVTKVQFPTWTILNGQDDLVWSEGVKVSQGTWKVWIPFSEHNYENGIYVTHIYTYDTVGNKLGISNFTVEVKEDVAAPIETSSSNASYDIFAYGVDAGATTVWFPTWSTQDQSAVWHEGEKIQNGVWKATIPFSQHIGIGLYTTHIYVGNTFWKVSTTTVKHTTSIRIPAEASLAAGGYEVYVDGVGEMAKRVSFPTWTNLNGQDDLVWSEGEKVAEGTWKVWIPFSEHNYEKGSYNTHIYTYDAAGNKLGIANRVVEVKEGVAAPDETSSSNASYDIIAYGIDAAATNVKFSTWSAQDQNAISHEGAKIQAGVWKVTIPFGQHVGIGLYTTNIYVDNVLWKMSSTTVKHTTSLRMPKEVNLAVGGYEINVDGVGDRVTRVRFPTWTNLNGQDDLVWSEGEKVKQGTWKVWIPFNQHNNEKGSYITHVYTYDAAGNNLGIENGSVMVK